jgi:hypothetical protein
MKIRAVGAEYFLTSSWTNGQKDMTKLVIAFRNYAKTHKIADAFQSCSAMAHVVNR